jgi:hypothetical protein
VRRIGAVSRGSLVARLRRHRALVLRFLIVGGGTGFSGGFTSVNSSGTSGGGALSASSTALMFACVITSNTSRTPA